MKKIHSLFITVLFIFTALVSCATGSAERVEDLNNTIWTGSAKSSSADQSIDLEGFFLSPDGRLMILQSGITGDNWKLEGDKLILGIYETVTREKKILEYTLKKQDGILILYSSRKNLKEPLQGRSYTPESLPGVWGVLELSRSESLEFPREGEPYLEILSEENGLSIQGFGGVNLFRGSLTAEDLSWKSRPLMRTLMAGPFLPFEDMFMQSIDNADCFLSLGNQLFLYQGTELLAVLSRE